MVYELGLLAPAVGAAGAGEATWTVRGEPARNGTAIGVRPNSVAKATQTRPAISAECAGLPVEQVEQRFTRGSRFVDATVAGRCGT
jgi:hypothetical protein